jgi:hypothetical protein
MMQKSVADDVGDFAQSRDGEIDAPPESPRGRRYRAKRAGAILGVAYQHLLIWPLI